MQRGCFKNHTFLLIVGSLERGSVRPNERASCRRLLTRRQRGQCERVNRPLHLRGKRVVHYPVTLDLSLPFKQRRNDLHAVMPASGGSAGMTNVQGALVFNLDNRSRESLSQ